MTSIFEAFINMHPVLTYYILTFVISWGGGLIVLGPDRILGIRQPSQAQFLFAILAGIAGPSLAGILLTGLIDGRTALEYEPTGKAAVETRELFNHISHLAGLPSNNKGKRRG